MVDAGLLRCGKSCRLRWMNYLRPNIKRGNITPDEEDLIIRMHSLIGNRWSLIAGRLPGRTDNEIKNYWNTHLIKKLKNQGGITDPNTNNKLTDPAQESPMNKKKIKNKNKNKGKKKVLESEKKTLLYIPKPIRVKTLSSISASTTSQEEEQRTERIEENGVGKEGENDRFGLFFAEHHHEDLVTNSDMECQSGFLEKLYEEYLNLLKNEENIHDNY